MVIYKFLCCIPCTPMAISIHIIVIKYFYPVCMCILMPRYIHRIKKPCVCMYTYLYTLTETHTQEVSKSNAYESHTNNTEELRLWQTGKSCPHLSVSHHSTPANCHVDM